MYFINYLAKKYCDITNRNEEAMEIKDKVRKIRFQNRSFWR